MMTNLPHKVSRIDFNALDLSQIEQILRTGDLQSLSPQEREYFNMMELVRGLHGRMMLPGGNRVVTKAGIIKLLKSDAYGLSDWMARRVYSDALNFFYSEDNVKPRAWANIYADRLDKMANLAVATGKLTEARGYIADAAKLRGCFDEKGTDIPTELLEQRRVIVYATDAESLGAPAADRKALEAFIDSIPEVPRAVRDRVKEDSGIKRRNLLNRMAEDVNEFAEDLE